MRASAASNCPTSGSSDRMRSSFSAWLSLLTSIPCDTEGLNRVARDRVNHVLAVRQPPTPRRPTGPWRYRGEQLRSTTFINVYDYEGVHPFSDADVYVVSPDLKIGLNLSPLYIWGLDVVGGDRDLYEFDTVKKEAFGFRAIQFRRERLVERGGELHEVWEILNRMRENDLETKTSEGSILRSHSLDTTEAD